MLFVQTFFNWLTVKLVLFDISAGRIQSDISGRASLSPSVPLFCGNREETNSKRPYRYVVLVESFLSYGSKVGG